MREATRRLTVAGSAESARLDAELLLGHVTGWPRAFVLAHPEHGLTVEQESAFHELVERRAVGGRSH